MFTIETHSHPLFKFFAGSARPFCQRLFLWTKVFPDRLVTRGPAIPPRSEGLPREGRQKLLHRLGIYDLELDPEGWHGRGGEGLTPRPVAQGVDGAGETV